MKTVACVLLVLACALPLRADEALQNGNFSEGITHWHGDGRSPADFASDNPLESSDPFTSQGLIIPLKHVAWSKVAQDFKGKIAAGVLTVTYKLSPDLSFSEKPEDYLNIPNQLSWGWRAFNTPPGDWLVFISAFGDTKGMYYLVQPKTGSSDVQTFRDNVTQLTPLEEQTITLAFPPGTGTVVVLSISLTDAPSQ
jgi:hypothetical protein